MNISHLLVNSAQKYPDKIGIVSGKKRFSYRSINERTNRLTQAMKRSGIGKGDRVALLMYNTHHFVEVYFTCLKLGAIAVPVNYRFVEREIKYVVTNSEAIAIFFDSTILKNMPGLCQELDTVKTFVGIDVAQDQQIQDYEAFLSAGNSAEPEVCAEGDDPCQIMYTSGTTGKPKGAVTSHNNLFWNLINTTVLREHHLGEVSLVIGPLFHAAALNNHLLVQVALAGTSILIKQFEPEIVLRCIEEEKATVISGSPAMFKLLLQYPQLDRFNTSSITKCTTGAAIMPEETKKKVSEIFPNAGGLFDLYGCTEASPTISGLSAGDSFRKKACVGPPAPFLEVKIVVEHDNALPPHQIGELICRGPTVMQGYFKDPEATAEAIKNGWLYTGDLARTDEEGYVFIVDRKKDMIISGGENIYPREIEEVLLMHPEIMDAAVVGAPHTLWGETVKAFVVRKGGGAINEQEVIDFCKSHLASYKKPTIVEFIDSIPKNPSGKPLKRQLREI